MAEGSCGCKGIRYCLLCENSHPNNQQNVSKLSNDRTDIQLANFYHYCVDQKRVSLGRWADCTCSEKYSVLDNNGPPKATVLESNNVYAKETLSLENDIFLFENFLAEKEELTLEEEINKLPWKMSQSGRRKQDFGPKANFKKKKAKIGNFTGLPSFSKQLVDKLQSLKLLEDFVPVEVCHLEYTEERGSAIDPHIDDNWLWGERLVTISLCSTSILTLSNENESIYIQVPMPKGSLLVLKGTARHLWKHAVWREDIHGIRIAITFRELSKEFVDGNMKDIGQKVLNIANSFNGKPL